MKKIKFLNAFIILLIIIFIINYLTNIYLEFFENLSGVYETGSNKYIFGSYTRHTGTIISLFTFIGLFFIQRGLYATIKNGFFNQSSATKFKISGMLFLVSGILSLIFDVLLFSNSQEIALVTNFGQDLLLILIGFSLYIIADIIINGRILKQENDLTI